jgi:hypothetical protein
MFSRKTSLILIGLIIGVIAAILLFPPVTTQDSANSERVPIPPKLSINATNTDVPTQSPPITLPNDSSQADDTAISGFVRDESGSPVPEARVMAYHLDTKAHTGNADQHGQFSLRGLNTAKSYEVSAVAVGFNHAVETNVACGTDDVILTLTRLSIVQGRVSDAATGAPLTDFEIAYLEVVPESMDEWIAEGFGRSAKWRSVSDPDGRYELADIQSDKPFAVAARAGEFAAAYVACPAIEPGVTLEDVRVQLKSGGGVRGTVFAPDGTPTANASILVGTIESRLAFAANCAADGTFTIANLPAAHYFISAQHPEYDDAKAEFVAAEGTRVSLQLRLTEGGAIEGVVTSAGLPLEGRHIIAAFRGTHFGKHGEVTTDKNGRYRVGGLRAGEYDVIASLNETTLDDSSSSLNVLAMVESGKTTIANFVFKPATSLIEGRITVSGNPPHEAKLRGVIGTDGGDVHFEARVEKDGSFRTRELPGGAAYIEVMAAREGATATKKTATFNLADGETHRQDFDFDPVTAIAGKIEGLPDGMKGDVMAIRSNDITIDLSKIEELLGIREMAVGTADIQNDRTFRIEGLDPGEYTIVAICFNPDDDSGDPIASLRAANALVTVVAGQEVQVTLSP